MGDKAVDTYPYAMKFVVGCFMTQEKCDKAVNMCFCIWFFSWLV